MENLAKKKIDIGSVKFGRIEKKIKLENICRAWKKQNISGVHSKLVDSKLIVGFGDHYIKFVFSKKPTKIDKIFTVNLTLTT